MSTLYHLRSPIGGFLASFRCDSDAEASIEGRRILTKLGRKRGYVQAPGRRVEVAAVAEPFDYAGYVAVAIPARSASEERAILNESTAKDQK